MAARRAPELDEDDNEAVPTKRVDILDRSRAFGEITSTGGSFHGAHYSQNDRYGVERFYDGQGKRVRVPDEPEDGARPPSSAKGPPRAARLQREVERKAQMEDDGEREFQPGDPVLVGDINLTAWLLKKEKHPWGAIRKAIEDRYHKVCTNETEGWDFLKGQGLASDEQFRDAGIKLSGDS